jgi:hypothetical protein
VALLQSSSTILALTMFRMFVHVCLLQEHAQQQQADAPEESFEDEWAALPPEMLAMVAELQSRG